VKPVVRVDVDVDVDVDGFGQATSATEALSKSRG
jgi:hypothetical protein